ncbi:Hypothetical predicted protein [Pelobates cultripes]|uniref:Uncharacterized protein n=1 Tax=Pelobates cultripes TaxID=61616 RepID=A0AAD1SXD0_PELCU|nr:Hypothetical predicted protein [Pelobates cultripes]
MEDFAAAMGLQLLTRPTADRSNIAPKEALTAAQPPRDPAKKRPPPQAEAATPR